LRRLFAPSAIALKIWLRWLEGVNDALEGLARSTVAVFDH
jgi:hypothetical protein